MSKERQSALLAKIRREAPELPKQPIVAAEVPQERSKAGRGAQFWLHDEDRRIIRELYAWLANQGLRANDSGVIRAALRMAKPGDELLRAYTEGAKQDGRARA